MTDNEIIKALDNCLNCGDCDNCVYSAIKCIDMTKDALDLINRQKAEIERQKRLFDSLGEFSDLCMGYTRKLTHEVKTAKAEAIKEFAERLKTKIFTMGGERSVRLYSPCTTDIIDNLAKEMTEGKP